MPFIERKGNAGIICVRSRSADSAIAVQTEMRRRALGLLEQPQLHWQPQTEINTLGAPLIAIIHSAQIELSPLVSLFSPTEQMKKTRARQERSATLIPGGKKASRTSNR